MIISGKGVKNTSTIHHGFLSVLDLAPTLYELAGVCYPEQYKGEEVYPLKGYSLLPFISGRTEEIHSPDYIFALEHYGNAMLRKGNWKITNFKSPFTQDNFALYNLSNDIGEQYDLKELEAEKYEELLVEWKRFSGEIKARIPVPASK